MTDQRRVIPGVDSLLASPAFERLVRDAGRARVVAVLRSVQAEVRAGVEADPSSPPPDEASWYARAVTSRLRSGDRSSLGRVINATGVVLHTNLGRAPLADSARRAVVEAAGYAALEMDLESGGRGSRHDHCVGLLRELTGAEDALVVNNNAAAVVLALNTLAAGAEVVISRGELVEIGGSFRVPEILERSGARLREVGATNRTHRQDFEAALGPNTGAILKVHRSNFRMEGFTREVEAEDLAALAEGADLPLVHDLGSGALLDLTDVGLPGEPTAREALEAGPGVVTMSGDKLLGGPQAGIVLGRAELVGRMRRNPLCRAVRCDKLTLAELEATLMLYRHPDRARREIPVLRMLSEGRASLEERAHALAERLAAAGIAAATREGVSAVGGGAYPGVELPTTLVAVTDVVAGPDTLARRLRGGMPPVVARVGDDLLLLDPRTVDPAEEDALVAALTAATQEPAGRDGDG